MRSTDGFLLGMAAVAALTRARRRGRLVAALLLLLCVTGPLAMILARPEWLLGFFDHESGWARFTSGLVSSVVAAAFVWLLGFSLPGPRGDQASRRCS